jgi:ParB-like chromosome segregation protein Spo0J
MIMSKNKIHCKHDKLVDASELVANPRNPNQHGSGQIAALAKILETQGWRSPVVVSNDSGFIVSGHGRVLAALKMSDQRVPVSYQDFQSEAEEWAHLIADNRLAELSEISTPALAELLSDLDQSDLDLELTGYDMIDVEKILLNSDLGTPEGEEILMGDEKTTNEGARMVQLFFTLNEFDEFTALVKTASDRFETENTTETIVAALRSLDD